MNGDRQCDVVVIGSGIAGISTAYELTIKGQHVIIVAAGELPAASRHEPRLIWRRCATI